MFDKNYRGLGAFIIRTAPGCLLAALITGICFRLRLSFATTAFLYLIVVVLQSLTGSLASSAVVSFVTVGCLDYFFVPPIFSLQVTNPLDGVALLSFLITGLVITRLTTQVRKEVTVSECQRRQISLLYDLASQLLALDPDDGLLSKTVRLFREVFQIDAVCLYDTLHGDIHYAGNSQHGLGEKTMATYRARQDSANETGLVFRCLRATGETIGAIGFDGLPEPALNSGPLSALAAAMLERHRVFHSASYSAAAARVEMFRGAVLDALAHEFKTPLAAVLAAAGCLREIGSVSAPQAELAELIETEISRLSTLTSRVLKTSKLDGEEVKPRLEPMNVSELVAGLVDQYSRQHTDRQICVAKQENTAEILADGELLQIAVRQLLENACKYSPPGTPVSVTIDTDHERTAVRVRNEGNPIEAKERGRIFDRFYRGAESRDQSPGSGLGLYFARKIVRAHGGSVELEDTNGAHESETVFRVTLPLAKPAMLSENL